MGEGRKFRRRGTVTAMRLRQPRAWRTSSGDVMQAQIGDWWVTDSHGDVRSVNADSFARTYEHISGDAYRRVGMVRARPVNLMEWVFTQEGPARATPGMWVVTDAHGSQWPVPDDVFRSTYEPIDDPP